MTTLRNGGRPSTLPSWPGIPVPELWGAAAAVRDHLRRQHRPPADGRWGPLDLPRDRRPAEATDQLAMPAMDALSWALVTPAGASTQFRVDGLGSVAVRDIAGALHYTVDLSVNTTVDFA